MIFKKIKEYLGNGHYVTRLVNLKYYLWIIPIIVGTFFQILGMMNLNNWIIISIIHLFGLFLVIKDINKQEIQKIKEVLK